MKFISSRKYAGIEWECYKDKKNNYYIAINHRFGESVNADCWDSLWSEIIKKSKKIRNSRS